MVGQKIPEFTGQAIVNGTIQTITPTTLATPKVFIFYPLNFTFVCPTELHAFQEAKVHFDAKNVTIYGISVDSVYSHLAWLAIPREHGGIKGVTFPLIGDITKFFTRQCGVLHEEAGIAYRALFIVDHHNTIHAVQLTNKSIGRSVEETLRLVDAMLFTEKSGKACPANWSLDKSPLDPTSRGIKEYFGQ